jgi:carboxymethylenebutenolidase
MNSNTITLSGNLPAHEAIPDGPVRGGALVIQEAFGVNHHIEDVTRRLAAEGWHALAPHLFHRTGDPVIAYEDIPNVMEHMRALSGEGLLADIDACLGHLDAAGLSAGRVAITGFCMGGTVTFLAAAKRPLGAAVTFYGGGVSESRWEGVPAMLDLASDLQTSWLGLFGDQDQGIPVAEVEQLREAAAAAAVPTEIVRYADAGHGFHCDARPASHHEASALDAWTRTLSWFDRYVEQAE